MATLTVSPDAHPESTSVDGVVYQSGGMSGDNGGGTWSEIRNEAGSHAIDDSQQNYGLAVSQDPENGYWTTLNRCIFLFDTSALPDDCTIDSAVLSLYGRAKSDNLEITPDINIYAVTTDSDTALIPSDYAIANFGTTAFCDTTITYANWTLSAFNAFTLNANGLAAISKTGVTRFAARVATYDAAGSTPVWKDPIPSPASSSIGFWYADRGTANIPKLVITYNQAVATVTTQTCENVVGATATGRGNITDLGDPNPTAYGHCWGTSADPTTGDSVVDNGAASATGAFTSAITNLTPGTGYYTRAYATNAAGTSYGANVYFVASTARAGYTWDETDDNLRSFDENAIERKYIHFDNLDSLDHNINIATGNSFTCDNVTTRISQGITGLTVTDSPTFAAITVGYAVLNGTADNPLNMAGTTVNSGGADILLTNNAKIDNTTSGTLKLLTTASGYLSISEGNTIVKGDYLDLDLDVALRFIGTGKNIDGDLIFRDTITMGRNGAPVNLLLHGGTDLIVSSDGGSTEVARIDGATGAITTSSTVDGIDVSAHDVATTGVHGAGAYTLLHTGDVDDTPVNGATTAPVSSNWAYDLGATTKEPTGFPNTSDTSAPTFSSPTVTLAKTDSGFDFYIKGVKYTKTANQTVSLPSGDATDIGTWYIAFNAAGTLTATKTTSWDIAAADSCPVAVLYFNGTAGRIGDERHGTVMDAATHDMLHYTVGTRYQSGLTGTFTDTANIDVALGIIHDEDLEYSIDAQTQCIPFYHASGVYTFAAAQNSYVVESAGVLQYDNLTDIVDVSNNQYVAYWIFATLDTITPIWTMPGQRQDNLLQNARDLNKYESLSLGTLPFPEMKLLYRVIIKRSGTSEVYTETLDLRTVSNLSSGTYVATTHAALTGLLNDDHTQYFLLAGETTDAKLYSGADLIVYSDAGSTEVARWDGATGHIGIATTPTVHYAVLYTEELLIADNTTKAGVGVNIDAYKTSADYTGGASAFDFNFYVSEDNTQDWTKAIGVRGVSAIAGTSGGTASTKTVTGIALYYGELDISGAAANDTLVTNAYGFFLEPLTLVGNSKLTNAYGIKIGDIAGGTTLNYAIYTGAGAVRFGGAVTLASTLTDGSALLTSGAWTGATYNGLTITTTTGTFTLTSGKTFSVSNTLTLTATDTATLAIGGGGTLGTAAYTAAADYVPDSLFNAHSVIYSISDNTPVQLTVGEQTLVGRLTGANITAVSIGIADNNILQVDHASPADDDYAKFTAAGIEGRSVTEVLGDLTGANFDVGGFDVRGQTVTADALTSGRVVFAGASGVLSDDSDFTFATDTLTVTKIGAFQATGAIDFNNQNMTNIDIDSGDIAAVTFSGDNTWSVAQTGVTLTSPTINGTIATTGLTLPAHTLGGQVEEDGQTHNMGAKDFELRSTGGGIDFRLTWEGAGGPAVNLSHVTGTPATNDNCGAFYFKGSNSAFSNHTYSIFLGLMENKTSGAEAGKMHWINYLAGAENLCMTLSAAGALWVDASVDTLLYKVGGVAGVSGSGDTITCANGIVTAISGEKIIYVKALANDTALAVADGVAYITIPDSLNGMNLVDADIAVYTTSSSGLPTVMLEHSDNFGVGYNDMLSTAMTIDETEYSSYTAAAQPVIDANNDDVSTGEWIRVNVTTAGTGTKGLDVILTFQTP